MDGQKGSQNLVYDSEGCVKPSVICDLFSLAMAPAQSLLHSVCVCFVLSFASVGLEGKKMLVGCLTSQQHASVSDSQGLICLDNCICCHTELEVADPTFHLTQSQ